MPCDDGSCGFYDESNNGSLRKEVEALLCVALTYIESLDSNKIEEMCKHTNWVEAGVTEHQLLSWWEDHKKKDIVRRKHELEAKKKLETRNKALEKLTAYERKLLGVT